MTEVPMLKEVFFESGYQFAQSDMVTEREVEDEFGVEIMNQNPFRVVFEEQRLVADDGEFIRRMLDRKDGFYTVTYRDEFSSRNGFIVNKLDGRSLP